MLIVRIIFWLYHVVLLSVACLYFKDRDAHSKDLLFGLLWPYVILFFFGLVTLGAGWALSLEALFYIAFDVELF